MIFEGSLSVKAIIKAKRRKVDRVYIDKAKHSKDISYLLHLCKMDNIEVLRTDRETIDKMASGKTHGGILCEANERVYQNIDDIITDNSFICLLEGIEDPFNLGYIFRSLYSSGCTGVLMNSRNLATSDSIIVKSSAGASEFINIVQSDDLVNDLAYLKTKGIKCLAAYRNNACVYTKVDYTKPVLIGIGGDMRGLSKEVINMMDGHIYIPYANDFRNALNASSATSVIAYEILRQRSEDN